MPYPFRLSLWMLGINSLGVVAGLLREPRPFPLTLPVILTSLPILSWPLLPLVLLAALRYRHAPQEATFGGLLAAVAGPRVVLSCLTRN